MLHRDRFLFPLHITFLISASLLLPADKMPNADVLSMQAHGKVVSQIPGGAGTVSMAEPPTNFPTVPMEITPNAPGATPTGGSSNLGGVVGLVVNAGKASDKVKRAADAADAARRLSLAKSVDPGVQGNPLASLYPNEYDQFGGKLGQPSVIGFPDTPPEVFFPMPTPAPVVPSIPPIITTPLPMPSAVPTTMPQFQFVPDPRLLKGMPMMKGAPIPYKPFIPTPLPTAPQTPSAGEVATGLATTAAGGWGAYTTGMLASAGAAVKTAAVYVGTVAAANPVTVVLVGGAVIGGGIYYMCKKPSEAVKAVAHREIHNRHDDPSMDHAENLSELILQRHREINTPKSADNIKAKKVKGQRPKSELRNATQPGNPLERGAQPFMIDNPGQGHPHGYKDAWGHYLEYTPKSKAMAIETVTNGTYHGMNEDLKHVFTYKCPETGMQRWAHVVEGGGISNCGINATPMPICPVQQLPHADGFVRPKGKGHGVKVGGVVGAGGLAMGSTTTKAASQEVFAQYLQREIGDNLTEMPELRPAPTEKQVLKEERRRRRAIENVMDQYKERLNPDLSPDQKMQASIDAREFLIRRTDL